MELNDEIAQALWEQDYMGLSDEQKKKVHAIANKLLKTV